MRGHGRGPAIVSTLIAVVMSVWLGAACNNTQRQAHDRPPPASTVPSTPASASPCPAPPLEPGYLPSGVQPTQRGPLLARPERTRTWESDEAVVQLLEGFKADHGDEPDAKTTPVRGDDAAHVGSIPMGGGNVLLVDWGEPTRCGHKQYAVATRGLTDEETLKIARSLRDANG